MDVQGGRKQVSLVENNRLAKRPAEKMTLSFIPTVKSFRIAPEEVPKKEMQILLAGANENVDVVWHQTESMD
jgi:hypothetical protein